MLCLLLITCLQKYNFKTQGLQNNLYGFSENKYEEKD